MQKRNNMIVDEDVKLCGGFGCLKQVLRDVCTVFRLPSFCVCEVAWQMILQIMAHFPKLQN